MTSDSRKVNNHVSVNIKTFSLLTRLIANDQCEQRTAFFMRQTLSLILPISRM
jgi:hypothetical protein